MTIVYDTQIIICRWNYKPTNLTIVNDAQIIRFRWGYKPTNITIVYDTQIIICRWVDKLIIGGHHPEEMCPNKKSDLSSTATLMNGYQEASC